MVVKGYRFEEDTNCKAARFKTIGRELGGRFEAHVLQDSAASPDRPKARAAKQPHSVFSSDLVDAVDVPTRQAVDGMIAFVRARSN